MCRRDLATGSSTPRPREYEFSPMDGVIFEYTCQEGNYALPGIMAGARPLKKEQAQARGEKAVNRQVFPTRVQSLF